MLDERLNLAFKRFIHVLGTGKNRPYKYGRTILFRAEVHILELIGKTPGVTASDIVDKMGVTKGAISQIIAKLQKKGLLRKSFKENNQKIQELSLTEKGKEVLQFHSEYEKKLLNKITPELDKCRPKDVERFITIINSAADFMKR